VETLEGVQNIPMSTMSVLDLEDEFKEALCAIKVVLHGNVKKFSIKDELKIDYENIEYEMEVFPNKYHLWSMLYSEVKEQFSVIEKKIKKRKGILYDEISKQGGGKMRRADISDLTETDKVLNELELKKIIIEKQSQKLWFTLEALKMKNDNLRSLAGFRKQELYQAGQSV